MGVHGHPVGTWLFWALSLTISTPSQLRFTGVYTCQRGQLPTLNVFRLVSFLRTDVILTGTFACLTGTRCEKPGFQL
ncbi:hypothetical protein C8R45DRAFT_961089 [Mycena sanguinolenta]|nr:hypothetical protein C8R45DRAFT_961089 [Mycena sanguinolenta]